MDIARHLITQTVTSGDLATVLDAGVTPAWLTDPTGRVVWDFITEYHTSYGRVPSPDVLASEYPNYKLITDAAPVAYLLDTLRHQRRLALLELGLLHATNAFTSGDVDGCAGELARVLRDLEAQVPSTIDKDLTATTDARMLAYRERADAPGGLRGLPTGFDAMDTATGGYRPGQLICLVGPPKAGKSTWLLWSSLAAWVAPASPMFVTFEMTAQEQEERLDALEAQVSASALRDGSLADAELSKVARALRKQELRPSYWLTEDSASTMTVSGLIAKVERLKPSILFIDGVYLMHDELGSKPGEWLAIAHITRALKRAAKELKIPIVITSQVRLSKMHGGEITAASIGYGPSFAEDCDLLVAVQPTKEHDITGIKTLPSRNVAPFEFWMKRDWASGLMTELQHDPFGDTDDLGDDDAF